MSSSFNYDTRLMIVGCVSDRVSVNKIQYNTDASAGAGAGADDMMSMTRSPTPTP